MSPCARACSKLTLVQGEQQYALCSEDLFRGKREVIIRHSDKQYRLQITKAGKLILNK
ncbi:MAG: hemin uptake protein HemP [Candidatus Omnitrophota bacterium]|nr:hemin uptake protein HemP [Candidatus Omnitrophota bacterium]